MKDVTAIKAGLSVLFLLCLFDMPYGYFQFARFIGMLGFAYLAYTEHELRHNNWRDFFIISAILINPLFKISLGRGLWNIVDVVWAVILISTIFNNKKED